MWTQNGEASEHPCGEKDGPGEDGPGKDGPGKDGPGKDGPGKDGEGKDMEGWECVDGMWTLEGKASEHPCGDKDGEGKDGEGKDGEGKDGDDGDDEGKDDMPERFESYNEFKLFCQTRGEDDCKSSCPGAKFKGKKKSKACEAPKQKKIKCKKLKSEEACARMSCKFSSKKGKCQGKPFSN